jgi:LysM repeat protein
VQGRGHNDGIRQFHGRLAPELDGDSLHGIARDFGLTAVDLARANGLDKSAILREGALLTIPAATPSEAAGSEVTEPLPSSGSGRRTSASRAKRATSG